MAEDQNLHSIVRSLLGLSASQQPMETNALIRELARRIVLAGASFDETTGVLSGVADAATLDGLDSLAFARLGSANAGSLLAVDNTHDIGASGATRFRDLFLARNAVIGGTLALTGVGTFTAQAVFNGGATFAGNLIATDATHDIGASGATRFRDLFLSRNAVIGGTLALTGVGTFTAQAVFNGGATFAGNLIATDATHDIGASGATRFRDLFLSRNAVIGGTLNVTGNVTLSGTSNTVGTITSGVWNAGAVTSSSALTFASELRSVTSDAGGAAIAATELRAFANTTHGACVAGFGATNDFAVFNKSIAVVANVPTGTTNFNIVGALSKGSGTFLIDHPLDRLAKTTDLYHGFIEGPRYDLLYRGAVHVDSETVVSIDVEARMTEGTFIALTQDPQVWAQHETGAPVRAWVERDNVHLASAVPGRVSWLVIAERCDSYIKHTDLVDQTGRLVPEQPKVDRVLRHPKGRVFGVAT